MSIDWDAVLLGPVMDIFGEGNSAVPASMPVYTPRGLAPFALADAVFDAAYEQVEIHDDGSQTTTKRPILGVRTALFPRDPAQNDIVFVPATTMNGLPAPGRRYIVKDAQADGHGHAKLMLMETVQ